MSQQGSAFGVVPINVVGGVILRDGKVFCARRGDDGSPEASKWEFPGGKVEPGEDPRKALARELAEELGVKVRVQDQFTTTSAQTGGRPMQLTTFICKLPDGAEPTLREHADAIWLTPPELLTLDWAEADRPTAKVMSDVFRTGQGETFIVGSPQ